MKSAIAESFLIELQAFKSATKPATAQGTKEGPHNRNFIVGTPPHAIMGVGPEN